MSGKTPGFENLIECPYEKSHQILPERMQTHLVKCRRSHPDEKKVPCYFNSTHLIGECELKYHLEVCPDKKSLINHVLETNEEKVFEPVPITNFEIECSENWDNVDVPTYDPTEYLEKNNILINKQGLKPAERRLFLEQERRRHAQLQDMNKAASSKNSDVTSSTVQMKAPRRPISVADTKKDLEAASSRTSSPFILNGALNPKLSILTDLETSDSSITSTTSNRYETTTDTDSTLIKGLSEMSVSSDAEQWITAKRKTKPTRGRGRSVPTN